MQGADDARVKCEKKIEEARISMNPTVRGRFPRHWPQVTRW
jgi:hypothetical protein